MTDSTPQRHVVWRALRRFGAIGLLVGIASALLVTSLVGRISQETYTADGTFIVPLAPPVAQGTVLPFARPTNAYDAQGFAKSYTAIIASDQQLLGALTQPTGMTVDELGKAIAAVNLPSTPAIRVTFTADTEAQVKAYFATMQTILNAPSTPTPYLPAGNLRPLNLPTSVIAQPGLSEVAGYVGDAVGILIGLAAAVLLERLIPQVRNAGDLRAISTWPVLDLSGRASADRYQTIVLRALDGSHPVRDAAVVTTSRAGAATAEGLVASLEGADAALRSSGRLPAEEGVVHWRWLGALPDPTTERGVQDAGAVVLSVPHHAALRATTTALQRLEDLAVRDVVIVLHGRQQRSTAARRATSAAADPGRPASAQDASLPEKERTGSHRSSGDAVARTR